MDRGRPGYIGRFAPSPTGELHFGSLVAAVGSRLQARRQDGQWLVRIEDIDPPREVPGSAGRILADLERLGMRPDQPVFYQSRRLAAYDRAVNDLLDAGLAFHCACTRADLPSGGPYPGTCRNGLPDARKARSVRVRVTEQAVRFRDGVQGEIEGRLTETCGDFVIRRADGLPAYQLAVVLDDAMQGVTEVVRGADLLDSTPRQIHLQTVLGLPRPDYLHLPLVVAPDGRKLSKRLGSDPLADSDPVETLRSALHFLGQDPPRITRLDTLWDWAIAHWDVSRIPRGHPPTPDGKDERAS